MHISPMALAGWLASSDPKTLHFVRAALEAVIGANADENSYELTGGDIDRATAFEPERASIEQCKLIAELTCDDWERVHTADTHALGRATRVLSMLRQYTI